MELMEAVKGRRSVRKYKPDMVSDDKVNAVLEAATWAPKASERWEFIVVKDAVTRRRLAMTAKGSEHVGEAPVDIVICSNLKGANKRDRELYSIQEAAAAAQNLMLKAYEEGLGTCLVAEFREAMVTKVLNIPRGIRPLAITTLGYPDETPSSPERKSLDKIVHRGKY